MRRLRLLLRDTDGAAALEMALVAPIMVMLMGAIYDCARFVVQTQQIKAAAQAGADWARVHGWNEASVEGAVSNATPLPITAAAATQHLWCTASDAADRAAGSACPGGGAPGAFVLVSAQARFTPALPWTPLAARTLAAQAVVRTP